MTLGTPLPAQPQQAERVNCSLGKPDPVPVGWEISNSFLTPSLERTATPLGSLLTAQPHRLAVWCLPQRGEVLRYTRHGTARHGTAGQGCPAVPVSPIRPCPQSPSPQQLSAKGQSSQSPAGGDPSMARYPRRQPAPLRGDSPMSVFANGYSSTARPASHPHGPSGHT